MIRLANNSDIKEIYEIVNKVKELKDYNKGEEYPIYWVRNVIKNKKENLVLVYEKDKNFAGFLIAHLLYSNKDAIRNNIYVKPEFRRKGIANELVMEYEKRIKKLGFDFSISFVNVKNKKMQNFNDKHGYLKGNKFFAYYKWIK